MSFYLTPSSDNMGILREENKLDILESLQTVLKNQEYSIHKYCVHQKIDFDGRMIGAILENDFLNYHLLFDFFNIIIPISPCSEIKSFINHSLEKGSVENYKKMTRTQFIEFYVRNCSSFKTTIPDDILGQIQRKYIIERDKEQQSAKDISFPLRHFTTYLALFIIHFILGRQLTLCTF